MTVQGLIIEKYASPAQAGAIAGDSGDDWVFEDNEVRWNHGTGIRAGDRWKVLRNKVHHNGQLGIGTWKAVDLLVEGQRDRV